MFKVNGIIQSYITESTEILYDYACIYQHDLLITLKCLATDDDCYNEIFMHNYFHESKHSLFPSFYYCAPIFSAPHPTELYVLLLIPSPPNCTSYWK